MENPITHLKDLSEPLTKLVDAVSTGVGTLYAPFGTIRNAKAEAEAKVILAKADSQILDIKERAQLRLMHRESIRQENIEKIASKAAIELPTTVSDRQLDEDWILQFFDYAQDVCDEDLQTLWSRILAGEVSSPNSFSKRTLQFLKTIDKWEAEKFSQLCSFSLHTPEGWNLIFHSHEADKIINKHLKNSGLVDHFSSIGLIQPNPSMPTPSDLNGKTVYYHDIKYTVSSTSSNNIEPNSFKALTELPCSLSYFTSMGNQLARIAGATPVQGYIENLSSSLKSEELDIEFIIQTK